MINLIFCTFFALHFYLILGEFINNKISALPLEAASIFSYILLIFIITILFRILREGFFILVKSETTNTISKSLGLFIGFIRGLLISGLILFGLLISTMHYLEMSSSVSFFGPRLLKIPVQIYENLFYGVVSKIFPEQGFNQEIKNVIEKGQET